MALIIEDGTMPEGANTFASVAEADAYLAARGMTQTWIVPDAGQEDTNLAAKEAALIRAADFMGTLSWKGQQVDWSWPLCWPRKGIPQPGNTGQHIAEDTVPAKVKNACIEIAALFYAGEDLMAATERGGRVQSETVGPISISYFSDASNETFYPAIAGLLGEFLTEIPGQAGNSYRMVNVVTR